MGIVSGKHILTRRDVVLTSNGSAWADLTRRINAITLFAQNFGDMYKPSENAGSQVCKSWMTVPQAHDYLVAPVSLMKEIKQRSWEEGEVDLYSPEIAKDLFFSSPKEAFKLCGPSCKHNFNRVHQLRSTIRRKLVRKSGLSEYGDGKLDIFAEKHGAILFGENSVLDVAKFKLPLPPVGPTEIDSYHEDAGSCLQASYQTNSTSVSSAGINSDPLRALSSAESTRTSLSPSDSSTGNGIGVYYAEAGDATCGKRDLPQTLSAGEMFSRISQADNYAVTQGTGLSQQAVSLKRSPVANTFTDDVPASYRLRREGGNIVTALKEKVKEVTPSRWKRKSKAT